MREIKFRAWDREGNNYSYWKPQMIYQEDWALAVETPGNLMCPTYKSKRFEFMQFTGHTGKGNVPIYEGDILKFFDKIIAVVVWSDFGGWSYKWIDPTYIRIRQINPE